VDGDTAFKLHDTFGFPVDLTGDVCRERGVSVDEARFNELLEEQRTRARAAGKFKMAQGLAYSGAPTAFHGYEHLVCETAKVTALYVDGSAVEVVRAGEDAVIVLDHTPFYAESGGQVGDRGELRNASSRVAVHDTLKIQADVFGHHGSVVEGELKIGDPLVAKVDADARAHTVRNHSATHLMHKALREVLGAHVQQKGSLVSPERTRFDFAHGVSMTAEQITQVEALVNAEVLANAAAERRGDGPRIGPEERRHDAVRREVRRDGARAVDWLQQGTVRRHARQAHRRHRPVQDRRRGRGRGRHPPRRSCHRRRTR
jgi:alanyl-tRNA synthetase